MYEAVPKRAGAHGNLPVIFRGNSVNAWMIFAGREGSVITWDQRATV